MQPRTLRPFYTWIGVRTMETAENFRMIEGPKESFEEQVRTAQQDGWVMSGQPLPIPMGEYITYSVKMIMRPKFEPPRRRSVSVGWR
jgi:hypothetical protein